VRPVSASLTKSPIQYSNTLASEWFYAYHLLAF
jgi:hypothetical protein